MVVLVVVVLAAVAVGTPGKEVLPFTVELSEPGLNLAAAGQLVLGVLGSILPVF